MFSYRKKSVAILVLVLLINAGCSTAKTLPERDVQRATISRWTRCIVRFSDAYEGPIEQVGDRAYSYCEGHGRDVAAIYPDHLKNQIESLLSQRANTLSTARVIKTGRSVYLDAFQGSQLDTLKEQLNRAHRADL